MIVANVYELAHMYQAVCQVSTHIIFEKMYCYYSCFINVDSKPLSVNKTENGGVRSRPHGSLVLYTILPKPQKH